MVFNKPALRVLSLVAVIAVAESSPYPTLPYRTLSLEDLVPTRLEFYPERFTVSWVSGTEFIYAVPGVGLRKYNAEDNTEATFINDQDLVNISKYSIAPCDKNLNYILLSTNRKKVYRYSSTAEYAVYNLEEKTLSKLGNGPIQVVVWGHGRSLAYVQNNNVYYVKDVAHIERVIPLTTDGIPGEMYYGITDWIYEEEIFDASEALWFSPKGSYLAVASFNDTKVESASYPYYGNPFDASNQYLEMIEFKYPKAGHHNPVVGLRVFKLHDPESEPWNIPAPVDVVGVDHVLGSVNWATDQNLIVLWLNRRQNDSVLVNCDLKKDKCDIVKERTEPNGWIDVKNAFFDESGMKMVDIQPLYQDDQRFMHAALFDFSTRLTEDLSPGNNTVQDILGWHLESNTVYYTVSPSTMPWQRQMWATSGGVIRCISCREPSCHHVSSTFAPGAAYAILSCSSANIPPKIFLYNAKEDTFKLIHDNSRLSLKLKEYKMPIPLYSTISLNENVSAHVRLLLPPDMVSGEKYPMIVKVYAGPGTSRVKDNFELEYSTYLATNRSFVVCYVDVRGSGAMGVEPMYAVNNALGTLEVTDTLHAIRRLVKMHSFIDEERVGVWGWSYGGFTAGLLLAHDARDTLACGAAVAPVTSWLYYDSIYTERYMDTPDRNKVGYDKSSLINAAEKLRNHRFLLVHGTGDDNVHYQHSMLLAKRLQHLDIAFEQMSYADENHSLLGVSRHFYHTLDHFWTKCFE